MKVSIPTWTGRVSPVFDVAKRLLVVELKGDGPVNQEEVAVEETQLLPRVKRVAQLGVDVLICGAISMPLEAMLVSAGVRVSRTWWDTDCRRRVSKPARSQREAKGGS